MAAADLLWVGDRSIHTSSPSRHLQSWSDSAWGAGVVAPETATTSAAAAPPSSLSSPVPKKSICKYFASGGCTRGELCSYSHDLTIDAATDADAHRGFVLTGQVVNLKHSGAGAAGQSTKRDTHTSHRSPSSVAQHAMNPDARPFVLQGVSAAEQYDTQQFAAATSYHRNARQPPITHHQHYHDDASAFPSSYGQHPQMQTDYYRGGGDDMYVVDETSADHHEFVASGGGAGYMRTADYRPREQHLYYSDYDATSEGAGGYYRGQFDYQAGDHMGGVLSMHHPQHQHQQQKWKPSGVFSTTADSAAAKTVLAGFYDHHALLNKDESLYQHRRSQALRPPLQSSKVSRPGGNSSSSSHVSDDDCGDSRSVASRSGAAPSTWTHYPRPADTTYSHQSGDALRKLRNR